MVMGNPKGARAASNGAKVTNDNVIGVVMEDLSEKDWEEVKHELQRELKEEMAERRRKKLAYFQKTRSGVVKKGDTTRALVPVNYFFNLEELVHMIDVSVNSR
jgi:pyruvoyl-dependent arginine decarboxylase (PvlArgDC)